MGITLVTHAAARGNASGATTSGVNTAGANLIALAVGCYFPDSPSVSDSKGNNWTALTQQQSSSSGTQLFYCLNPTVGSGHTFTVSGSFVYASIAAAAFSGVAATSAFDVQNGAHGDNVASIHTGSITPSVANDLIVSSVGFDDLGADTVSVDSSLATTDVIGAANGSGYGIALAYLVQTAAAAINPNWTASAGSTLGAAVASFKAAAASIVPLFAGDQFPLIRNAGMQAA